MTHRKLQPLSFAETLFHSLHRAIFVLGLCWNSPDEPTPATPDDGSDCIRATFRFDSAGEWLTFHGTASAIDAETPQIRVRVGIPVPHLQRGEALEIANQVNKLGLAPVHVCAERAELLIQHAVVFTGYNDSPPGSLDPQLAFAQREAVFNMLAALFSAVHTCVQDVWPERQYQRQELQRVNTASEDQLKAFSVFVISRMYRAGLVSLRPGSPALQLLRDTTARCLPSFEHVPDHVNRTDALLHADLDMRARLRELMSDPPDERPLRQLRLLESALARQPQVWEGVEALECDLRVALAVGLDLGVTAVPEAFVERLCERHGLLSLSTRTAPVRVPPDQLLQKAAEPGQTNGSAAGHRI